MPSPMGSPPFEEALLNRMDASAIFSLVEKEPLLSYRCFVLYYGFDQPIREIARALGIMYMLGIWDMLDRLAGK